MCSPDPRPWTSTHPHPHTITMQLETRDQEQEQDQEVRPDRELRILLQGLLVVFWDSTFVPVNRGQITRLD